MLFRSEKERMRGAMEDTQKTTLTHTLPGNPFRGFELLLKSRYLMYQALFFLLMTWIATIQYFLQADLISKAYSDLETRTLAFANVDLVVNVCSAAILILGISHVVRRFGVTFGLVITPITMALAFVAIFVSPTLFVVQAARSLQRITQYAIARPCREILFTVVDQQTKYKAKNVIDTTAYRFGDVSAAWMNAGLQSLGLGLAATGTLGVAAAGIWGFVALALGRSYERMRKNPQTVPADA